VLSVVLGGHGASLSDWYSSAWLVRLGLAD
jgi:hypothetical protein